MRYTKSLDAVINRSYVYAFNHGNEKPNSDYLLTSLLEEDRDRTVILLRTILGDNEIDLLQSALKKQMGKSYGFPFDNPQPPRVFTPNVFEDTLYKWFQKEDLDLVDTSHLLIYVLDDSASISSRILQGLGVDFHTVKNFIITSAKISDLTESKANISDQNDIDISKNEIESLINQTDEDDDDSDEMPAPVGQNGSKIPVLDRLGIDMTDRAGKGEYDPVIGRDKEIERLIHVLSRRKKNNPVIVGEAGVGKSALVESLAQRIADNKVPKKLRDKKVYSLDIAALIAGTKYRGDFELRMNALIKELENNREIILFIDEIHTIVGSGSTQGSLDTANILKPALSRGRIQCIGATTLNEYRENIEKDGALDRRFQKIIVESTTKEQTLEILTKLKDKYQTYHDVTYTEDSLKKIIDLASRYLPDRQFPDKAIDLMDESGALASVRAHDKKNYKKATVNEDVISQVVSLMTSVPLDKISESDSMKLSRMSEDLEKNVIGQKEAVSALSRAIKRSRSGLKTPNRPIGVFMFVGPSGVGKTYLAKELGRYLFDREDGLVKIDMSEYSEKHNVSRLIGSPPGYVGYSEGGQLTELVRNKPYSVILFDEIEKAHPDVYNIMLQIFDEGCLTDGNGRKIDFKNTVIILTSNVGSKEATTLSRLGYALPKEDNYNPASGEYRKSLEKTFSPEFINRLDDIIVFNTLTKKHLHNIVDLELNDLADRFSNLGYKLLVGDRVREHISDSGYDSRYGARHLKRRVIELIEDPLSEMLINGELKKRSTVEIYVDGSDNISFRNVDKKSCKDVIVA